MGDSKTWSVFTMDDGLVLIGKVTISASLKKIHFPKISEHAPFKKMTCTSFQVLLYTIASGYSKYMFGKVNSILS